VGNLAKFIIHIFENMIILYTAASQFKYDGIAFVLSGREMVSIMPEQGRAREVRLPASGDNRFRNGCNSFPLSIDLQGIVVRHEEETIAGEIRPESLAFCPHTHSYSAKLYALLSLALADQMYRPTSKDTLTIRCLYPFLPHSNPTGHRRGR